MAGGTYPVTAPTRGTYEWFQLRIGLFLRNELGEPSLGTNADPAIWDDYQVGVVDEIIQEGALQFYFPPLVMGQKIPYTWAFLMIEDTVATASSDFDYDLDADCGGIAEDFVFTSGDAKRKPKLVSAEEVMSMRGQAADTGTPEYIAIRPKTSTGSAVQTYEAIVYPTPTFIETLNYRFLKIPPLLTTTNNFPYGTVTHANTIAASCLSVAEALIRGTQGPMHQRFMQCLQASVMSDMRSNRITANQVGDLMDLRDRGMQPQ